MSDLFWSDNPQILYKTDRLLEFFISQDQTQDEKLNSIARFGIYVSIVLSMYKNDAKYLSLGILTLFITFIVKKGINSRSEPFEVENIDNVEIKEPVFTEPTINNPFGNSSITDIIDNPERPPMKDYASYTESALETKEKIEDAFNYNLYKDLGDIYNKKHSQREFYTIPSRGTIPADPDGKFKQWLYGGMGSFKDNYFEGGRKIYEPLQYKK
jgi:hypothetical protein